MASWSFFEGKTVDAALEKAGRELGIPVEKLEYETVFAGSSGIFGLVGAKNAKIRVVTPRQSSVSKPTKSADAEDKQRQEILSLVDETFGEAGEKKNSIESRPDPDPQPTVESETDAPAVETKYTEADFEPGKTALLKIIESIVDEGTISVQINNQQVLFNIEGDNAAMLIGKHGQTLKAMQHIVEKVVHKSCGERVRVQVDVEKYMEKRKASLKSLATRLADKVKQTGKPTTINRMDAFERKIIHDTLRKDKNVKTRSSGGGEIRNVVIHPGKKNWRSKKTPEK